MSDDRTSFPPLRERLAGLAAFLPVFEAEGFSFGEWHAEEGHFPYYELSDAALALIREVGRLGWMTVFDWPQWARSPDGQRLLNDQNEVAQASVDDLQRLLTVHIRADRFTEGHLASAYESGDLNAILRRAETLLRELEA
jgi:hypothetical protein